MKEDILKGLGNGLVRSLPLILFLDIGFGVGPINLTLKGINVLRLKVKERNLKKLLKEGEFGTIYLNEKATKGYVYLKQKDRFIRSYFSENITKPDWYMKDKES